MATCTFLTFPAKSRQACKQHGDFAAAHFWQIWAMCSGYELRYLSHLHESACDTSPSEGSVDSDFRSVHCQSLSSEDDVASHLGELRVASVSGRDVQPQVQLCSPISFSPFQKSLHRAGRCSCVRPLSPECLQQARRSRDGRAKRISFYLRAIAS